MLMPYLKKSGKDQNRNEVVFVVKKMIEEKHHMELVDGLSKQLEPILKKSDQPVCIYLDDNHKNCNEKFASMLGYPSAKVWNETNGDFLETFIDEEDQEPVSANYQKMVERLVGSVVEAKWKKKDGGRVNANVIHVPITFEGHLFALMFVVSQS